MIYSLIKSNEQLFPIEKMCKVLKVSSGSYYRWKKHIFVHHKKHTTIVLE